MKEKQFDKITYNNEFISRSYDRINLTVPKGDKEKIRMCAEKQGKSVNKYIYELIEKDMMEST